MKALSAGLALASAFGARLPSLGKVAPMGTCPDCGSISRVRYCHGNATTGLHPQRRRVVDGEGR